MKRIKITVSLSVGIAALQHAGDKFCHLGLLGWRYPEPGKAAVTTPLSAIRETVSNQRDFNQVSKSIESMLAHLPEEFAWFDGRTFPPQHSEPRCAQGLRRWAASIDQQHASSQSIFLSNSLIPAMTTCYVYAALPIFSAGDKAHNIIAVGVPVSRVFTSLWIKERIIAVYLVFNACILTALVFFPIL